MTSRIFKGLHDPLVGHTWLLLPASSLEKTLSRILLSTIVYIIGSLIVYYLFSICSETLNRAISSRTHILFNPFAPSILKGISIYFSIQTPFLIGAVYFKRHVLSKTIVSLLIFTLFLGLGAFLSIRLIFGEIINNLGIKYVFNQINWGILFNTNPFVFKLFKFFILIVFPLVSWTICYFRHTETEK